MTRTRTITWHDPAEAAALAAGLTGLEILHRITSGLIPRRPPPSSSALLPTYVMPGRVVFAYEPREEHYNTLGAVHGGILTTVLDTVMGCAIHSKLEAGIAPVTIELKTSFVHPVTLASGHAPRRGNASSIRALGSRPPRRKLEGEDGTLYAHASSTWLIYDVAEKLTKKEALAA